MFTKIFKIFFILFIFIITIHKNALAEAYFFLDAGVTKTSEANANVLRVEADVGFDNVSYEKPEFNDDYETGTYRAGGGYINKHNVIINGQIKYINQDDTVNLNSPGSSTSYVKVVDFFNGSSAQEIKTKIEDDVIIGDISAGKRFMPFERLDIDLFAGLRYADLERKQSRTIQGNSFGTVASNTHATSDITQEFSGIGVRASTDSRFEIGAGFGIFGGGGVSLLSGEKETTKSQLDRNTNPLSSENLRLEEDVIVVGADIMIGIDWKTKHFSLGVGYEMDRLFNAFDHFYNDSDAPVGITDDFSMDTFFARAKFSF